MKNVYEVIKNKKVYVISPHIDDAILSCGYLLINLAKTNDITIVNVFTDAHEGPYTMSAKRFLQLAGNYKSAKKLYSDRLNEEDQVINSLGVKLVNLGYKEALFRKKDKTHFNVLARFVPEIAHKYPFFNWIAMKFMYKTESLESEILAGLETLIDGDSVVLAPLGIATHIDHKIVFKIISMLKREIIYYSEFPYNLNLRYTNPLSGYLQEQLEGDLETKRSLLTLYKSQYNVLFTGGILPQHREYYYCKSQGGYQVEIVENINDTLANEWQTLWVNHINRNTFNSPDWTKNYMEVFKPKKMKIITVYKKQKLFAVLPLVETKLFGTKAYIEPANKFAHRSTGLIDTENKELMDVVFNEFSGLKRVILSRLSEKQFTDINGYKDKFLVTHTDRVPQMNLVGNKEGNLIIPRLHQIIKKAKYKFDSLILQDNKENDDGFDSVLAIDKESTKSAMAYNVFSDEKSADFYRKLINNSNKYIQVYLLEYNNLPIAYELGFSDREIYMDSERAYLKEYESITPGKVILIKLAQKLFQEGYKVFDLGPGNDNLKKSLATHYISIYDIFYCENRFIAKYIKSLLILRNKVYEYLFEHKYLYIMYKRLSNRIRTHI